MLYICQPLVQVRACLSCLPGSNALFDSRTVSLRRRIHLNWPDQASAAARSLPASSLPASLSLPLLVPRVRLADDVQVSIVPLSGLPPNDLNPSTLMSVPCSKPVGDHPETHPRSRTHLAVLTPLLHRRVHLHTPRLLSCPCQTGTHGRLCDLHRRHGRCRTDQARESWYRGESGRPRESS
jgi:hypothetical protein